jgi:hypothetical protein
MLFRALMLAVSLHIPLFMICAGRAFTRNPARGFGRAFGYRTPMSLKNKDTWEFAHMHCGRTWLLTGAALLPPSAVVMMCFVGAGVGTAGTAGGIVCAVQSVVMGLSILPTEAALRKTFDKNGGRLR